MDPTRASVWPKALKTIFSMVKGRLGGCGTHETISVAKGLGRLVRDFEGRPNGAVFADRIVIP
jgi:hypothetical protein